MCRTALMPNRPKKARRKRLMALASAGDNTRQNMWEHDRQEKHGKSEPLQDIRCTQQTQILHLLGVASGKHVSEHWRRHAHSFITTADHIQAVSYLSTRREEPAQSQTQTRWSTTQSGKASSTCRQQGILQLRPMPEWNGCGSSSVDSRAQTPLRTSR